MHGRVDEALLVGVYGKPPRADVEVDEVEMWRFDDGHWIHVARLETDRFCPWCGCMLEHVDTMHRTVIYRCPRCGRRVEEYTDEYEQRTAIVSWSGEEEEDD